MTLLLSGCSAAPEESQSSTSPEIVEESPTEANPQSGHQNWVPESEETAASEAEEGASPMSSPFFGNLIACFGGDRVFQQPL